MDDGKGGTTKTVSNVLLPSLFRAKVDHPTFETWKTLSEKIKESWEEIQVSFLKTAEQKFWGSHDSTTKFKSATQRSGAATQLSNKDRKLYEKACKEGTGVNKEERDKVMKAKESKGNTKKGKNKKDTNGGLGTQYNLNQQLSGLPKGTILVPVKPQAAQNAHTNNASTAPPTNPTNNINLVPALDESNEIRAANFLQLANGNFVVGKTSFQLSSSVSNRISVQSYTQRSKSKGLLWIDSGTNVSAMGRCFKLIEETGRHANMTGFANDL
eukprot:15365813-Ditylum_brightwellii.AAC.1